MDNEMVVPHCLLEGSDSLVEGRGMDLSVTNELSSVLRTKHPVGGLPIFTSSLAQNMS